MTPHERIQRLRTVRMYGLPLSVDGLRDVAKQFAETAHECDSAAHEMAAMQLRWAADKIGGPSMKAGEDRRKVKRTIVEVVATIAVEWPEGVEYSRERAIEAAVSHITQKSSVDVAPSGNIVWAERYSECNADDAVVVSEEDLFAPEATS